MGVETPTNASPSEIAANIKKIMAGQCTKIGRVDSTSVVNFDLSSYNGHESFTKSNFFVIPTSASARVADGSWGGKTGVSVNASYTYSLTYTAPALSVTSYATGSASGGYGTLSGNVAVPLDVYLVIVDPIETPDSGETEEKTTITRTAIYSGRFGYGDGTYHNINLSIADTISDYSYLTADNFGIEVTSICGRTSSGTNCVVKVSKTYTAATGTINYTMTLQQGEGLSFIDCTIYCYHLV